MTVSGNPSLFARLAIILLFPLWFPLALVAVVLWLAYRCAVFVFLHLAVWIFWLPRGKRMLFVYSESSVWQAHIEEQVLPRIRDQAVVLNWSQRSRWSWREALARAMLHHFGGSVAFNPMAVVFRPFKVRRTFRFFQAFRDYKHGRPDPLSKIEREFFQYLNAGTFGQDKQPDN